MLSKTKIRKMIKARVRKAMGPEFAVHVSRRSTTNDGDTFSRMWTIEVWRYKENRYRTASVLQFYTGNIFSDIDDFIKWIKKNQSK